MLILSNYSKTNYSKQTLYWRYIYKTPPSPIHAYTHAHTHTSTSISRLMNLAISRLD